MEAEENNSSAVLLDFSRRTHAVGLGTGADTPNGIRAGMALYLGGNRIREVGPAENGTDALSRDYADNRYCRPRLLWENPEPDKAFSAQTVQAAEACSILLVVLRFSTTANITGTSVCIPGIPGQATVVSGSTIASRGVLAEADSITFEGGYSGSSANQSRAIPLRVYGM